MVHLYVRTCLILALTVCVVCAQIDSAKEVIERLCQSGNIESAREEFLSIEGDANAYHSLSALELLLNANVDNAVSLHKLGKRTDFTVIPPLAKRHLDGLDCAGVGDLFYVTAVIIKELVDTDKALPNVLRGFKTLLTLTSDSGLHDASEAIMQTALTLDTHDASLRFRSAVLTPGVFESMAHIRRTRMLLENRVQYLSRPVANFTLSGLDEFVLSPTFYFAYQGYNDKHLLMQLQAAYIRAYPKLGSFEIDLPLRKKQYYHQQSVETVGGTTNSVANTAASASTGVDHNMHTTQSNINKRKIRVGFVSSHFRRHSICKLFCGVLKGLDSALFDLFAFSSLQQNQEDAVTLALRNSGVNFVSIGMTFIQNRNEVVDRNIDILVSVKCVLRAGCIQLCF